MKTHIIKDSDHQPLRIAIMREDADEIRKILKVNPSLLNWGDGLAMIIAIYHNKIKSIKVMEDIRIEEILLGNKELFDDD